MPLYVPNGEYTLDDEQLIQFMERFKYPHPLPPRNYTPNIPWEIMFQQQELIDKLEERCNSLEKNLNDIIDIMIHQQQLTDNIKKQCNSLEKGVQNNTKRSRAPPRGIINNSAT